MRIRWLGRAISVLGALLLLLGTVPMPTAADILDYDLPNGRGHFYKQANGQGGSGETGFAITNDDGILFWDDFKRLGGVDALGYPASRRFVWDGFTCQATQKVVFQWRPEIGSVMFVNVIDIMHDRGLDGWLEVHRQTPPPFDTAADTGLSWDGVTSRHWAFLDASPAIKTRYWQDGDPLNHFGLPVSYGDMGNCLVIRAQRAIFQYWKEDVPWAHRGQVTIANGGDLAKEAGLLPAAAIVPEPPSGAPPASPAPQTNPHDWRVPGYVAAVGGQLYDTRCVPLRSVGINVPNLAYRNGLDETLEWMRQHHLRWMRVFATGHSLGPDRAPADANAAVAALRTMLTRVEQFNATHDPSEAIYVLVSLTDYYPPGVPGDRYAFDHPTFSLSPVLPAPWFRPGAPRFDFDQEHDQGRIADMPNYEVNYKPWVRHIVSSLSSSPALMGWQLGNELKARGSPLNGISGAQAYDWYLAFTGDMVDTIRQADANHLIFLGAQYMAELVDWEYRPDGYAEPDRLSNYRHLIQRMLDAHGQYDWNVWSLTAYDFNPYPVDDAAVFGGAGVAVVATEYGFTWGTPIEMSQRFGGDRAAAVRRGLDRPWTDLDGRTQPRLWSALEMMTNGPLAGIAPWGSPAPGPDFGLDTDGSRGITGMPDEAALWTAWTNTAVALESTNRAAGPAVGCLACRSSTETN